MPYISPKRREQISVPEPRLPFERPRSAGELTWLLCSIIEDYRQERPERFDMISEITAALEATATEFQRRVVDPFESVKAYDNGAVFEQRAAGSATKDDTLDAPV